MKQYLCILTLATLAACGQPSNETAAPAQAPATEQNQTAEASEAQEAQAPAQESPAVKAHGYGIKDGLEYGYETAISDNDAKAGQVANKVMMMRYSGEKDGKYQVHAKDGAATTVIECDKQCDYIKTMVFIDNQMMQKEMMKGGNGSIASIALADAINGQLEPYVEESKGKKYHIWYSEKGKSREEVQ